MRRGSATTLQDVADAAGVSCMVASVVLNGARSTTRVSDTTREKIVEAGQRLKYRRNAAALGLSRRKMNTVGVVATIDGGEFNLYTLELLNGILEGSAQLGQNTTVFAIKSWEEEEHRLLEFCDGRIDGLVLLAPALTRSVAGNLPHRSPLVTLHSNTEIPGAHNLDVDNEGGAYQAVMHMLKAGHRDILHITAESHLAGSRKRTQGYQRAHEEFGQTVNPANIVIGNFSAFTGRRIMTEWIEEHRPLPTAIFCASDAIASGCLEVLLDHGIRVPADISVAGFDDTLMARMTVPPLTTIRQPFREMGRRAVELLVEQIRADTIPVSGRPAPSTQDPPLIPMVTDVFPTTLVVRQSVGPPSR